MIVVARKDGRGGIRPFGKFNKQQAGATVEIGNKKYKVTKDGRVNIPKKIMDKYGVTGSDKRKRIAIDFSSKSGKKGWKKVGAYISKPGKESKNLKTGDPALFDKKVKGSRPEVDDVDELVPESDADYTWS